MDIINSFPAEYELSDCLDIVRHSMILLDDALENEDYETAFQAAAAVFGSVFCFENYGEGRLKPSAFTPTQDEIEWHPLLTREDTERWLLKLVMLAHLSDLSFQDYSEGELVTIDAAHLARSYLESLPDPKNTDYTDEMKQGTEMTRAILTLRGESVDE